MKWKYLWIKLQKNDIARKIKLEEKDVEKMDNLLREWSNNEDVDIQFKKYDKNLQELVKN